MANLEEVMAAIVDHGVQRIVALGYFMTPLLAPECRDLLNAARVNIIGVTNVFEAARLARLNRVIFASTVGIFGYQDGYGSQSINENTEAARTKKPLRSDEASQQWPGRTLRENLRHPNRQSSLRRRHRPRQHGVLASDDSTPRIGQTRLRQLALRRAAQYRRRRRHRPTLHQDRARRRSKTRHLYGYRPLSTGREIADIVIKYLPGAEISFDEKARVPAWNFDNSRAVKEFDWKIQSVEEMVFDEINGTRQAAGLPSVSA